MERGEGYTLKSLLLSLVTRKEKENRDVMPELRLKMKKSKSEVEEEVFSQLVGGLYL